MVDDPSPGAVELGAEKSNAQHRGKPQTEVGNKANIHTSESQQEFFRMLDEKIEKGRDYCSEAEEDGT
uniref:Uncharacterized protein n=1 Tax=Knipowitschia caucasica TaxID=637954 RepID=A0AAV2KYH5_KNICA